MYNGRLKSKFSDILTPLDGILRLLNPNVVTLTGIISILLYSALFLEGHRSVSVIFLIFGVVCDVFDGMISRKRHQSSIFGNLFDGLADRINDIIIVFTLIYTNFIQLIVGMIILCCLLLLPYLRTSFERYKIHIGYQLFERVETLVLVIVSIILSPLIPSSWLLKISYLIAFGLITSLMRSVFFGFNSLSTINFSLPPPKDPITSSLDDDYTVTNRSYAS